MINRCHWIVESEIVKLYNIDTIYDLDMSTIISSSIVAIIYMKHNFNPLHFNPHDALTLVLLFPDIYGVKDVLDQYKYHLILIK